MKSSWYVVVVCLVAVGCSGRATSDEATEEDLGESSVARQVEPATNFKPYHFTLLVNGIELNLDSDFDKAVEVLGEPEFSNDHSKGKRHFWSREDGEITAVCDDSGRTYEWTVSSRFAQRNAVKEASVIVYSRSKEEKVSVFPGVLRLVEATAIFGAEDDTSEHDEYVDPVETMYRWQYRGGPDGTLCLDLYSGWPIGQRPEDDAVVITAITICYWDDRIQGD